jgi:hypothetical protein
MDNAPKFAKPHDVAGAIEAIESVGWKLAHTGYVNASGTGQAGGVFDSARLIVRASTFSDVLKMGDENLRSLLVTLDPKARDDLRRVLIRDQTDRDAISSRLMRYRYQNGQDWADVIDFLTMHPDARRRVVRVLAEIDAARTSN